MCKLHKKDDIFQLPTIQSNIPAEIFGKTGAVIGIDADKHIVAEHVARCSVRQMCGDPW